MGSQGYFLGLLLLWTASTSRAGFIPPGVEKCYNEDGNCLKSSVQKAISKYAKTGIREMNVMPFDPLRINSMLLPRNKASSVNIELEFKDTDLHGLQNAQILNFQGLPAAINGNTDIELLVPKMELKGPYTIDGSVLILPIVGRGQSHIVLDNVHVLLKMKTVPTDKHGRLYAEIKAIKLKLEVTKVQFAFTGLFNGNKELGDNMNAFLNENWKDIFAELEPNLSKVLGLLIKQLLNNAFSKNPYEEHFLH